jgi:hypothetical protein
MESTVMVKKMEMKIKISFLECTSLVPAQLSGIYSYSVFKILSVIGWCPINLNRTHSKICGPKAQNIDVLENGSKDFD